MTAEKINAAAWHAALRGEPVEEKVPEGWYTVHQLSKSLGKAHSSIGHSISRAVKEGRAERKLFRIQTGSVTRPVPHYKLK